MTTDTLWSAYQEGDSTARDELLSQHLRLVHHVARQMVRRLHASVELDDLISSGTMGLIRAIETFDPSRGLRFSTFAAPRIRGAILDDLRRWDHVPRSVRRKQRELESAREQLRNTLDREPSAREMAEELDIELDKLWQWESDTHEAVQVSLDQPLESDEGTTSPLDILVGDEGTEIEDELTHDEEISLLRDEILNLKERERIVLSLYYFEELKLHEIATILELTESRISQIRSQAIKTLRDRLKVLRQEPI